MTESILTQVSKTVEDHRMLKGVRRLLIAFSAGPDSVALLDILHRLYGDKIQLFLGYVDHRLRTGAKNDIILTKLYAKRFRLVCKIVRVNVKKRLGREGLEATARELRYKALRKMARQLRIQRIALAHTGDDFLETFLLNLIRGGARLGLAGMPPVREKFIRPLMRLTKNEILAYLKKFNLKYSLDRTNLSLRFRRNYVRKEIIPKLLKMNPNLHGVLLKEMDILRDEEAFLQIDTEKVFMRVSQSSDTGITLDIKELFKYTKAQIRRVIRKAILLVKGNLHGIESHHVDDIIELGKMTSGKVINLPCAILAEKEYGKIKVKRESKPAKGYAVNLKINGRSLIKEAGMTITTTLKQSVNLQHVVRAPKHVAYFDYDELQPPICLRNRKPGDFIFTFDGCRKKIKDIFINDKVPRAHREQTPILFDQEGILWLVGVARSNRAVVTHKTKNILVVKIDNIN